MVTTVEHILRNMTVDYQSMFSPLLYLITRQATFSKPKIMEKHSRHHAQCSPTNHNHLVIML